MGVLETILTTLLASGVWLVLLAFLGKSLITNWLSKDIEQLKGRIAAQNIEKQIVLSRVSEMRAEAISQIYLGLVAYVDEAKKFVHRAEHVAEAHHLLDGARLAFLHHRRRLPSSSRHDVAGVSNCRDWLPATRSRSSSCPLPSPQLTPHLTLTPPRGQRRGERRPPLWLLLRPQPTTHQLQRQHHLPPPP